MPNLTLSVSKSFSDSESTISLVTDDLSILDLPEEPTNLSEEALLAKHGYSRYKHVRTTLQGELFTATKHFSTKTTDRAPDLVAIKKISKYLYSRHEAQDDDGFTYIVDEDIVKEAIILRHLTVHNQPIGDTIVQYIDLFESDTHCYLVMEYVQSNINLKDFVLQCHAYIKQGKLGLSEYQAMVKYILWQLAATLHWLHHDMHCAHLDLVAENIMLNNVGFTCNRDGSVSVNRGIGIKLCDFGASEVFDATFACNKQHISLDNEQYLSPNIYQQNYYNASAADMWSLGMVIYFCFVGDYPYKIIQKTDFNEPISGSGYWSIVNNALRSYLRKNSLLKFINPKTLSLINGLLIVDESKRLRAIDVLKHQWFCSYYKRYSSQIERKSTLQRKRLLKQNVKSELIALIGFH
eukprot:266865_1